MRPSEDEGGFEAAFGTVSPTERRDADLFFADLRGWRSPRRAAASPRPTLVARHASGPARLFDRIVQRGEGATDVFLGSEPGDPPDLGLWTAIALPRSSTPPSRLRPGDLVLQRALGDGRLASLRALGEDVDARALYGSDGLIRPDTLVFRRTVLRPGDEIASMAIADVATDARSGPGGAATVPAIQSPPSLQFVASTGTPLPGARWEVHQKDAIYRGALDPQGRTGPIDRIAGTFDPSQPFRIHVEGCVCSIVKGAALLASQPEVEYGGQFVDWSLADDPDFQKRSAFWDEYDKARAVRGPLDVFRFLQHDHVMRRPVKLLARRTQAVFEARPLAIRLGPIVRYVDRRRALLWVELETPGLVRVTYGKAVSQRELPTPSEVPSAQSQRHATSVRVGGRHYALVWLDPLDADTVYQYTVALGPQPPSGPLPMAQADFTEAVFPPAPLYGGGPAADVTGAAFGGSEWLFFRTAPGRPDGLRFAHGSCRKWPGDDGRADPVPFGDDSCRRWQADPEPVLDPGPDMLEAFGSHWLARKNWVHWPQFFLHTGDQIYADDVGAAMGRAILRHRFASVVPGPASTGARDVSSGAWAGRFASRYTPLELAAVPPRPDLARLCALRPRIVNQSANDIERSIKQALRARTQAAYFRGRAPLAERDGKGVPAGVSQPLRFRQRVLNGLLWDVPDAKDEVPRVDPHIGLLAPQVYRLKGPPAREFRIEHPSAGETAGVHASDYAEYAALYEQAWSQPWTRRVLAHLSSYMIFDDHEVTDDWNADPGWLEIVHSKADAHGYWPTTMTDALCAYWMYQGWGNLAPEDWQGDPRVKVLERCRQQGRDALPELRRLVAKEAVGSTDPQVPLPYKKLAWNFAIPTDGLPFLAVDLRTDRDVNHTGGLSKERSEWVEKALARSTSPVAFLVLPVPYLLPDPMLFAFRHPGFVARLAGARSTLAFKRGSDLEHPAGNPVWDEIKRLLERLQHSSHLKTVVLLSGDIHFSCNLDGQLRGSHGPPRLLQLISSGLRQRITDKKQSQLISAYKGWLNVVSGADGVDEHRGVRITLGGLQGPDGKMRNFLFQSSVALVEVKMLPIGGDSALGYMPRVVQTHLVHDGGPDLVPYVFTHSTESDGRASLTVEDPGFARPASQRRYPAAASGPGHTGIADERDATGDEENIVVIEAALDAADAPGETPGDGSIPGEPELFAEDPSSLDPGQSIRVDGQDVRTYVDATAWYAARRDVLRAQQRAFVKDGYPVPAGLDDLARAADARIKAMRTRGTEPIGDGHVEAMLGWLDRYLEVLSASDHQMEAIAADRVRATQAEIEALKGEVARLTPRVRDLQRSAFRDDKTSVLKQTAETLATALDSVLVAEQWLRDAATTMDDFRVLGTTLRTQKALHGSSRPWHELMRETTNARVAKLASIADGLNKVVAAWQLVDSGITLLAGGKTASARSSAGISFAATLASAGGTLLGASGFFNLYSNLYLGPMVKAVLGQIDQLKDTLSTGRNHPFIQLGRLDQVDWSIEPGGRDMYEFMHGVMKAGAASDIKAIPGSVRQYFSKHRRAFDAGTPKRHGVHLDYANFADKRVWVFAFREDIWGMLYGSMKVP